MEQEVTLAAEKIAQIGPFIINNSLLTTWVVMAVIIIFAYFAGRNINKVPGPLQNFAEIVVEGLYSTVESLAGPRTKRFFPILATFFVLIITANYVGLLPGIGTVGIFEQHNGKEVLVPLFRSATADLNLTLALALISVSVTHYFSITSLGLTNYLARYISLNPIYLFVGILEVVAEFTKIVSLSFRLFGNIFAGETLLVTISGILAFIAPLPFMMLELLVGFVQAAVFMMLTLVFMTILTERHEAH
ncbi:MAG TPA: F0F1 ATP synthase subunit A [Candidatus Nanoarchaeia archaeon]|nr:ATP synthase subunit a [uncultured archaeon]